MTNEQRIKLIEERLNHNLAPTTLEIYDDGDQHIGHTGADGMGHFTIRIASKHFDNHSALDCHRMIYDALGDAMETQIHALAIQVLREP